MNKLSAWMCAQGLLARREHSRLELEQKLLQRDFDPKQIVETLDRLRRKGWQSDLKFCQCFIRSRVNKGQGPNKICYDLRKRGVDATIIEHQLQQYEHQWLELCRELYQKKYRKQQKMDIKLRTKQLRFLTSRGFSIDTIQQVMKE